MKKVFVGISGGVDSSVSAYLLKKRGYDVTGVFIRVWYPDFINCNWRSEMQDAMRVCAKLGIPFLLCDAEKEYKEGVIDYMVDEYKRGRTPNPDVMCNKNVKFDAFYNFAMENGADYIATGHYAQINTELNCLQKAADTEKDQTYFLWTLPSDIIAKTLFPIGHLKKSAVRKIAKKVGLLTAQKKDSQGLCFIGDINIKDFLKKYIDTSPGDIINGVGKIIGTHEGSELYTIGERHGFEIFDKTTSDQPFYVVDKNLKKNTITVSQLNESSLPKKAEQGHDRELVAKDININEEFKAGLTSRKDLSAKIRYGQKDQPCTVIGPDEDKDSLKILFSDDQNAITPGQSVVLYAEQDCIGGGIIS